MAMALQVMHRDGAKCIISTNSHYASSLAFLSRQMSQHKIFLHNSFLHSELKHIQIRAFRTSKNFRSSIQDKALRANRLEINNGFCVGMCMNPLQKSARQFTSQSTTDIKSSEVHSHEAEDETRKAKRPRGYPFNEIEPRWQQYWEEKQTFRTPDEVDTSKPKFYVLDMFPYPRLSNAMISRLDHHYHKRTNKLLEAY